MSNYISFIERWWHRFEVFWLLLIIVFFSLFFIGLYINGFVSSDIKNSILYVYVTALVSSLVSIYWWLSHRIQKCPLDRIGFLVSVRSESVQESIAIKRDFGEEITKLLKNTLIHVMQLNPPYVNKIISNETALKYANKCRAHFHIYGDVRKRRLNNKEVYAIRLDGMIRHAPTTGDNQRGLSKEMGEVLPLKINLHLENDLSGFEFTSVWMAESTKYVIATAAMLSGDYDIAIHLLEELDSSKKQLEKRLRKAPVDGIKMLLKKLPERLASAYLFSSRAQHLKWRETRNLSDLDAGWDRIKKYNNLIKNTRDYHLYCAIWLFVSKRDISGSINSIMSCVAQHISDPTWRYSAAFLEAYRGNEDKALRYYEGAIDFGVDPGLFFEVEEFISWVLSIEPERYQLYFCLGLINYKAKGDSARAKQDLEKFLQLRVDNNFLKFATIAEEIMISIGK